MLSFDQTKLFPIFMLKIELIKDFVATNVGTIRTVKDVARELNISVQTLKKTFLRQERIGLSKFIALEKIKRMQEMLMQSNEPCMQICIQLGFREDTGCKFFKRLTGMTMREYRHRVQLANTNCQPQKAMNSP